MKSNIPRILSALFLWFIAMIQANAQTDTIAIQTTLAAPDGMGNILVVTDNNSLVKLDSTLKIVATQNLISYGIASSIECNGGTEVVVYCFNTGQLVIFDNFLKEKNRYDLTQLIKPKPTLICISKTGWWCYDENNGSLTNYRTNFQKAFAIPEIINSGIEIVKMAEAETTYPHLLLANNALNIALQTNGNYSMLAQANKASKPSLNYNTPVIYTLSGDSITRYTLNDPSKIRYFAAPNLPHPEKMQTIIRSFNTGFFIYPNHILAFRNWLW